MDGEYHTTTTTMPRIFLLPLLLCLVPGHVAAFAPSKSIAFARSATRPSSSSLNLLDPLATTSTDNVLNMANSYWLATIDSDIANIPDNEFTSVFTGGIIVMLGGVLSALIVGFILEKRNLYANVVADSYAQGAQDEEFWKGLSDEEKKKTKELLQKVNRSLEGEASVETKETTTTSAGEPVASASLKEEAEPKQETKLKEESKADMFSDY